MAILSVIETERTPEQLYNYLKPHLGSMDSLLVIPVVVDAFSSQGLPDDVLAWLHAAHKSQQAA